MSFLAPAGTPLSMLDVTIGLLRGTTSRGTLAGLSTQLSTHSDRQQSWLLNTGRAAMTLALRAMKSTPAGDSRNEVIVPAYTCYSVPASVAKAGLRPRLCDIDPRTLNFDLERLRGFDTSRVLAVVSANLYGIPNSLAEIEDWARQRGVFMLDDAAQALGATYRGRPCGGFGDAGLYSFDKGKNITSMDGGALVARAGDLATQIDRAYAALPAPATGHTLTCAVKLGIYSLMLRPWLYGVVRSLPFLGLGRTVYDDTYPLTRYSSTLGGVAQLLFQRLAALMQARARNADALFEAIRDLHGVRRIDLLREAVPSYVRLPLLVNPSSRARMVAALEADGIGATTSYPQALSDLAEVAAMVPREDLDTPGAREVASSIVTLPVHPYCPPDLAARVRGRLTLNPA